MITEVETKKEKIEQLYIQALYDDLPPNVFAEQILELFNTITSQEIEELSRLAHQGLPDECVKGWGEVKFCENRQGDGNACKLCSHY